MNIFLLLIGTSSFLILMMLISFETLGFIDKTVNTDTLYMSVVVALFGACVIFLINYLGFPSLAGSMFLVLLLFGIAVSDEPSRVVNGRTMFLFSIPILMAGILLRPWASFIMAGLCTLTVFVIGMGADIYPNLPAIGGFFLFALISWISGVSLERSIRNLQDANEKLIRSEQELHKSEERYRKILRYSPDAIIVLNNNGEIMECNRAMLRMFRLSSQKHIKGTNIADLISPFQRSKATQYLKQVIEYGSMKDVKFTFTPSEGNGFPAEVSAALLTDYNGAPSSIVCVAKDISERKHFDDERKRFSNYLERRVAERTAELEAALSELESFSYTMSHDLRTPLRSIDGFAQAIIDEYGVNLDEQGKDYVDRIRKASQTMATTIDNLIDLSQVTRRSRVDQEVDLSQCVRSILTELEEGGKGRDVGTTVMDTSLVYGDQNLLTIAMCHLIENAWKFTDSNPYAKIEFGHEYIEGERVFYVRDNGVGFDMIHAEKLFQPFQRLHPTGDYPGMGVGLAMVKRIIARHGGKVWAEGKEGFGSAIYFTIPIVIMDKGNAGTKINGSSLTAGSAV